MAKSSIKLSQCSVTKCSLSLTYYQLKSYSLLLCFLDQINFNPFAMIREVKDMSISLSIGTAYFGQVEARDAATKGICYPSFGIYDFVFIGTSLHGIQLII